MDAGTNENTSGVDKVVGWVAFGAAWYFLILPEYVFIAWVPLLMASIFGTPKDIHSSVIWGIGATLLTLIALKWRVMGYMLTLFMGVSWGVALGYISWFATGGSIFWSVIAGMIVGIIALSVHAAAFMPPTST